MKPIGSFEVESGIVRITDPCYDKSVGCCGTAGAQSGKWNAFITEEHRSSWGNRVTSLVALHESVEDVENIFMEPWLFLDIDVGVDSGQAGIFDDKYYRADENFYEECGSHTLSEKRAGTLKYGAVSSSGLGDGSYVALALQKDGKNVGIKIDFFPEVPQEFDPESTEV